jgi:hypothetical protein
MKIRANFSINMDKVDLSRVFQGQKGSYLNLTAMIDLDEKDQYNHNGWVAHAISKEERESGLKLPILGNVDIVWDERGAQVVSSPAKPLEIDFDDTPF